MLALFLRGCFVGLGCLAALAGLTGCATTSPVSQPVQQPQTKEAPQEVKPMPKIPDPVDLNKITPEQVLTIFRDFLHDERVTVAEVTKLLIGSDIPTSPSNDNVSSGSISLWKQDKGLWYFYMSRTSRRPGYFKDGIVEILRISTAPKRFCIARAQADEILGVKPRVIIPTFDEIRDLQFTKEQLTNPGWGVRYELDGKEILMMFRFTACTSYIYITSK
ncbi:MAG: hypothetical protein KGZ83_16355 [Sulfuricella sp.]|nr:hypothetical protein [Sulfuricella sp.]